MEGRPLDIRGRVIAIELQFTMTSASMYSVTHLLTGPLHLVCPFNWLGLVIEVPTSVASISMTMASPTKG